MKPARLNQFLPGTGRGTARSVVEGAQVREMAECVSSWDPSVATRHLPGSGRN